MGPLSKKMELRKKSLDKGRTEREVVQPRKFKKGDVLGKGKRWQLLSRIGLSLGAEMKHDLL